MHLSAGNRHDGPEGRVSIESIGSKYAGVPLIMDKAYEGNKTRELAVKYGYQPIVPPKRNRKNPWDYDKEKYKRRNVVERFFRRLKAFRKESVLAMTKRTSYFYRLFSLLLLWFG